MQDLIYPSSPAPVIRGCSYSKASEMLPVVDVNLNVIKQAPREFLHGASEILHPVVHLHIIDREGRLYLQKRSDTKDFLPSLWDTAVGGHVTYGEFLIEALCREASEELGLTDFNPIFLKSYVFESTRERELVNVFAAVGNFKPVPDLNEVSEGRFWSFDEINRSIGTGILTPNFESEFRMIGQSLLALL